MRTAPMATGTMTEPQTATETAAPTTVAVAQGRTSGAEPRTDWTTVREQDKFSRKGVATAIDNILPAINRARVGPHNWESRNSHRLTSRPDHNRRSKAIKLLHGLAPVMRHQCKWYPDVYPEAEMQNCPRGCGREETQSHMLTCRTGAQETQSDSDGIKTRWTNELLRVARTHAIPPSPTILISPEWHQDTETATARDRRAKRKLRAMKATLQDQWLEMLEERYPAWNERCDLQIRRKNETPVKARKRRILMKQPRVSASAVSSDQRMAAVPPIPEEWRGKPPT
ncbi:hypothetical protein LPJ81_006017, partial [Coemansia sp. IMI 209127]